jgi:predicted dienelactone hydrolase
MVALTIILAIVQLLVEGYYWQYLPSYVLILFLIIIALFLKKTNSNTRKRLLQITLVFLILFSIGPWTIFLPIPKLTEPQGHYTVGTRIFRWVDSERAEPITPDPNDKRNVVVQAWYPTAQEAKGIHSSYVDGLDNLPEKIGIMPDFIFDHYDQIETYGVLNAPISKEQNLWPVILFLTGNNAARAFYTSLATGLASYGYVVLMIDHPYEAMITQLADGKIATTIEVYPKDNPDLTKFMIDRLNIRIADIQFVINQLGNPKRSHDNFLSSLDQNRIVIAGHSLGGASAAAAMAFDSRIKAAANIDGTLYGELPKPNGPRPFLLIESKKDGSDRFQRYENGNRMFFRQFEGGYRYEIIEADHYSFTDAPLLLAFPTRFLAARFLDIGNIPAKTHHATVDILDTFFYGALNGELFALDSVPSRHQGIIRKPID